MSADMTPVCEPVVQRSDGHPDLYFRNGGEDGPDARLLAAAPEMLDLLRELMEWLPDDDRSRVQALIERIDQ